jgi:hypothetical protein
MIRKCGQNLRRWKWNMVKKPDPVAMTAIAKCLGQRQQVIIMNPDNVVGLQNLVQFGREALVDPHIAAEIAAREFRKIQPIMQNRPEHSVGVPVVIFLVVLFGEVGQHVRLMTMLNRADRHIRCGSDQTAPAEPNPRVSPQNRADRDCKPARAASAVAAGDGDTIGDHDQPGQW